MSDGGDLGGGDLGADLGGEPACWAHIVDDLEAGADTSRDGGNGRASVDLADIVGTGDSGAVWSLPHGGDLDGNVVWLRPGDTIGEHVNDDVDVLVVVWSGGGELTIGGRSVGLRTGVVVLIDRGSRRRFAAGADGVTYLSVHRRRERPTIRRR